MARYWLAIRSLNFRLLRVVRCWSTVFFTFDTLATDLDGLTTDLLATVAGPLPFALRLATGYPGRR